MPLVPRRATLLLFIAAALCAALRTAAAQDCTPPAEPTFTVHFQKLTTTPDEEGLGWQRPQVWEGHAGVIDDSITVPSGRPIYALIVSGYRSNAYLDELMVYDFARHLMSKGAYVHYAWWNNLLAPWMERPLHTDASHPGSADLTSFSTVAEAANKAVPGEDYQFLDDAKRFLAAIRLHNPGAVIVIVGHSMGGGAVIHLAAQADVVIDLAAPIDPVGNRNYPWATLPQAGSHHFNWTRWRATRSNFRGYRKTIFQQLEPFPNPVFGCGPTGDWLKNFTEASFELACAAEGVHVHNAPAITLGANIINLHHRWQKEYLFPFDYEASYNLGHNVPPGGVSSQFSIPMSSDGADPDGWPSVAIGDCCPAGSGVAWPQDGHGEIVGYRGPVANVRALAVKVQTSPRCVGCFNPTWPARTFSGAAWSDPNRADRVARLKALELLPLTSTWTHEPFNPALCKVSSGLITRFDAMNKPPVADAGPNLVIPCDGCASAPVTLDASATTDPDNDTLTYTWTWTGGSATGAVVTRTFPLGVHCVTLEVKDPSGHLARAHKTVSVVHTSSPARLYTSNTLAWKSAAAGHEARAFDQFFPGLPGAIGCLVPNALPATLQLQGGSVTVKSTIGSKPLCAIADASTTPMVSDARHEGAGALVEFAFDPPVSAFYTYFGSLDLGRTAAMRLYSAAGALLDTLTTPPSAHASLAAGLGFTSAIPVARIEFTTTEPGTVLIGAFVGLKAGEQSIGTANIGAGYSGPGGSSVVQLDFAAAFAQNPCPADLTGDGLVNSVDLAFLLGAWGPCDECPADIDASGLVNSIDLAHMLGAWGSCP